MITPTPSEIAELAFIRRNDPETALRIAEQSGRAFDQQTLKAQHQPLPAIQPGDPEIDRLLTAQGL